MKFSTIKVLSLSLTSFPLTRIAVVFLLCRVLALSTWWLVGGLSAVCLWWAFVFVLALEELGRTARAKARLEETESEIAAARAELAGHLAELARKS